MKRISRGDEKESMDLVWIIKSARMATLLIKSLLVALVIFSRACLEL